jgi:TonB family protein
MGMFLKHYPKVWSAKFRRMGVPDRIADYIEQAYEDRVLSEYVILEVQQMGGTGPAIGGGGGGKGRIGNTGKRGSGSKFGWYAAKVQSTIREALARNSSTRTATFSSLTVKVWADANGRITRAQLVGSSGNPAVDQAIRNSVLNGLQLPQGPPADMPMPIHLRISARKPVN